jgi:hypothetical protein
MTFKIYAIVFARLLVIFVGYLCAVVFFLFTILGAIGDIYLTNHHAFITNTKALIAAFDKQLNQGK